MPLNEESLGDGLLVGQKSSLEAPSWILGNRDESYSQFFDILLTKQTVNIMSRFIANENNR